MNWVIALAVLVAAVCIATTYAIGMLDGQRMERKFIKGLIANWTFTMPSGRQIINEPRAIRSVQRHCNKTIHGGIDFVPDENAERGDSDAEE